MSRGLVFLYQNEKKKKTLNMEWGGLRILLKFEIIWMRIGQVIRLRNDANFSKLCFAQSTEAVEYTDCSSAEG